jgi:shikimate kinase
VTDKSIYLVGVKSTGKTTVGQIISQQTARPFLDIDVLIQELDSAESGMHRPVREIFAEDGRDRFMQLEKSACELVANRNDAVVVSTGGGLCENREAVHTLRGGVIVHLCDDVSRLADRSLRRGVPAYVKAESIEEAKKELAALFRRRIGIYRTMADLTIDIANQSPTEVAERVIFALEEHERGRQ